MICAVRTAFVLALACMPLAAYAQDTSPAAPEMTTATYRAWTLRCATPSEASPACEVVQTLTLAQSAAPVAQIALGRLAADQPMKLVVQVPAGVWLPADVRIDVPDGASLTMPFITCGRLCAAEVLPDEAFVEGLKSAQSAAILTFQDGQQQPVALEVSFDGLADALAAMEAEMAGK